MIKPFHLQLKGVIRFSYPATSGFRLNELYPTEIKARLYDPQRLDERFEMFEFFALRSIKMQSDQKFSLTILTGEDLPDVYMERLLNLVEGLDNVSVCALPPTKNNLAVSTAFRRIPTLRKTTHIGTFRLDDDDAMHKDTVARIRTISEKMVHLAAPKEPFAIAFNRGFFLDLGAAAGTPRVTEVRENAPLGIGLTVVSPIGRKSHCFSQNHRRLNQSFTTFTDVSRPMFIRTIHPGNDSGAVSFGSREVPDPEIADKHLREGFGISYRDLEAG